MEIPNKILLVDGNLLMFKSYYGWLYSGQPVKNVDGINTNGIHVFFITLFKIIKQFQITHCFVAFDYSAKTKRHELYPDYKAGRGKAPDDLFVQMDHVKELLSLMNIVALDEALIEADDLIAAFSKKLKNNPTNEILVFSADQDLLQLVDQQISVIYKPKGSLHYQLKTVANFFELQGFYPHQIIEYKGLSGDSADNLPGVAGIGPKTAKKLLEDYGTLENIYANLKELKPALQVKLKNAKEMAFLCRQIAILDDNVVLNFDLEDIALKWIISDALDNKLNQLELNQVRAKLVGQ